MVKLGPARGPKRADTGRAGPGLKIQARVPLRAETGLIILLFKIPLFIVRLALGSNKGIMNCYNL